MEMKKKIRVAIIGGGHHGFAQVIDKHFHDMIHIADDPSIEQIAVIGGRGFGKTHLMAKVAEPVYMPKKKKYIQDNNPWYDQYVQRKRKKR